MELFARKNAQLASTNEVHELEHIAILKHALCMLCPNYDCAIYLGGNRPSKSKLCEQRVHRGPKGRRRSLAVDGEQNEIGF